MRYFRNHISRFVVFVLAVQILNMSIDAPNTHTAIDKKTSDKFNYIDTYLEYIAEVLLKYENAIPESKNRQQKELQHHKQCELVFSKITGVTITFFKERTVKQFLNYSDGYTSHFIKAINPPPPKV